MTVTKIKAAIKEAQEFIKRAKVAVDEASDNRYGMWGSKATGASVSYISNTLVKYMPEVTKVREKTGLTDIQQRILEAHKNNPGMAQRDIAEMLGCSRSHVSLTYKMGLTGPVPRVRRGSYNKTPIVETYTLRPCLQCGKPHRSTREGDRICPQCKGLSQEDYYYEYSVALDSRVAI
jgi:hypothetical protein